MVPIGLPAVSPAVSDDLDPAVRPTPMARALMALVGGYRFALKPWLGNACRFEPTCSAYALTALARHGAARGSLLVAGRLARCHPWCDGGLDPVPPVPPRLRRTTSPSPRVPPSA